MGEAFRQIVPLRDGRVLVACFASNIHRVQQAVDVAIETGRSVAVIGRSMRKNVNIARNLGYLDIPDDVLLKPEELSELPPYEQMILCTGSQGEPLSALTRIAFHDHQTVQIERGDTVIISAKPIPGNELRVHDAINGLAKAGAEVLHEEIAAVHASGHGCAEELRTMISLLRPKAVMPVHGEFRMLAAHARLARESGVPEDAIFIAENGTVVELTPKGVSIVDQVETGVTLVDGLGVGDVADVALRDRRHLAEDGVLIVVTTLTSSEREHGRHARARRPRLRRAGRAPGRGQGGGRRDPRGAARRRHHRDQAAAGAPARRHRSARLRPHPTPADDPAGRARGVTGE